VLSTKEINAFRKDLADQELPNWFWDKHNYSGVCKQAVGYVVLVKKIKRLEKELETHIIGKYGKRIDHSHGWNDCLRKIKSFINGNLTSTNQRSK